uniref:CDP-diacylglycerol--inositol 3-phosphatidyltransferase n=1 Tax=Romanomermis culicivorax TaxID=13658 RepID=A0A915JID3_ROMCU
MTDSNIFLFVPNIIGYCRILFAFVSFYYMPTDYYKAFFFYGASSLMDAVDGYAARYFNQGTRFGAMLDMLMDRCGTMCLIMVLGHFYPNWMVIFQLSNALDIASHWLHMHVHDITGGKSHKSIDENTNPVLKLYYTSRQFLFFMCAGNELFYALLYLNHFTYGPLRLWQILSFLTFPIALVKSVISLVHLISASQAIGAIDVEERRKKLEK